MVINNYLFMDIIQYITILLINKNIPGQFHKHLLF